MTDGIVLLDKPLGLSSNAALQRVRRALGARKAGHVGSLDPLATGMLPICLGEATKVAAELMARRKRYRFAIALGARTATGDVEGAVVERKPVPPLTRASLESTLERFRGAQRQIPPMYSALKREGQPLYRLARAGIEVERAPRDIEIEALELLSVDGDSLELEAQCSKGTYIRVLAEDIANALGTCGHVTMLRRLWVEPFQAERMTTLDDIERRRPETGDREAGTGDRRAGTGDRRPETGKHSDPVPGSLSPVAALRSPVPTFLLPADFPLQHLPAAVLDAAAAARIAHGQAVPAAPLSEPGRVRLYDDRGRFLGIGECDASGILHPRRLLLSAA